MSQDSYPLSRGALASSRLYIQHSMWRYQLGYYLHPDIPQEKEGLKIVDVACGTGIWLIELAKSMGTSSVELDGFDISPKQFPPKEWLPEQVKLDTLDIMAPIPEHLVGKYDIVHIARVVIIVRNNDPGPLLQKLMRLLKPGGYLQWDEADIGSARTAPAIPGTPHPWTDDWSNKWKHWASTLNIRHDWVSNMDKVFAEHGLDCLQYIRMPVRNDIAKPWTDLVMMGSAEVMEAAVIPACLKNPTASPTADEWMESFRNMVEECQSKKISVTTDMIVAVGRKK